MVQFNSFCASLSKIRCVKLLHSALDRTAAGKPIVGDKGGRPRKVSKEGVNDLAKALTKKSIHLETVKEGPEFVELVHQQMAKESTNGFGRGNAETVSDKTLNRLIDEINAKKRTAKVKTPARTAAREDIRSALALCAVLRNVLECVDAELFLSTDDVSILVNDNKKPQKVLTTKEAEDVLKLTNTSISVTEYEQKHRVIAFNVTVSGGGERVCTVMKFADRNFASILSDKPMVVDVEDNTYVCLYRYGLADTIVNDALYRKCIVPCANRLRDRLTEGQGGRLSDAVLLTQSSQANSQDHIDSIPVSSFSTSASHHADDADDADDNDDVDGELENDHGEGDEDEEEEEESGFSRRGVIAGVDAALDFCAAATTTQMRKQYEWVCLACDGAFGQIDATTNKKFTEFMEKYAKHTVRTKWSASRSLSESPNDLGWMHSILHTSFSSYHFRYGAFKDPPGGVWKGLKEFLDKHLEKASFKTVWRALVHGKEYIEKAFNKKNILSAFRVAGIEPFDTVTILAHNPHFNTLSPADAQWVVDTAVPELAEVCSKNGYVPEEDFKRVLEKRPGVDNSVARKGKKLNDMAVNRQRAVILSHGEYMEVIAEKRRKKAEAAAAAAVAAAAGTTKTGRKRKNSTPALPVDAEQDTSAEASSSSNKRSKHSSETVSASAGSSGANRCCGPQCGAVRGIDTSVWTKCGTKYCRYKCCGRAECKAACLVHCRMCKKV